MITEIIRALFFGMAVYMAWFGMTRANYNILRMLLAFVIIWVSVGEVWGSVSAAATSPTDFGMSRKVGWPSIIIATLATWYGPRWLQEAVNARKTEDV